MQKKREHIKVTYATLASPNPLLHEYYEEAVAEARAQLGQTHQMYINGRWEPAAQTFTTHSPINTSWAMGTFQEGDSADVDRAVAAAKAAFPAWRATPWQERVALLRKVADLISERLFEMAAINSLEVGKNRLEAIGDVEEAADFIRFYIQSMEENEGFARPTLRESDKHSNRSVLKPYGVWGVIAPFNFPVALSTGPTAAALLTGNTVVLKPAEDTPFGPTLIAQCFHEAGLPVGVFNMVTGGEVPGKALVAHPDVAGITFTGSYAVGMAISAQAAQRPLPRPVLAEMGGKNPAIISAKADVEKAAVGVIRSAFGLQGQKCSACSRVYVHEAIKPTFTAKLLELVEGIRVGDPTQKENWMGPVINQRAFEAYQKYAADLHTHGKVLTGGRVLDEKGYFVAPTVVDSLPADHKLWQHEMFSPIVVLDSFTDLDEAMRRANDVPFGLTAGFYSEDPQEQQWFLDNIEAGVVYVNREAGATTGAWPGYQPFGGWKGSSTTGKAAGSFYYLQQYMHEQSQTIVG